MCIITNQYLCHLHQCDGVGADKIEMSVDLMRHLPNFPPSMMTYLFTKLMLWGRQHPMGTADVIVQRCVLAHNVMFLAKPFTRDALAVKSTAWRNR